VSITLEHLEDLGDYFGLPVVQNLSKAQALYGGLSFLNPRPVVSNYVTLVSLDFEALESVKSNACESRDFMAALLPRIAQFNPAVVSVDLAFIKGKCLPSDDIRNEKLERAITSAFSAVPIVLALGSETKQEHKGAHPDANYPDGGSFEEGDLVLREPFLTLNAATASWGLMRLNADVQLIPIVWNVWQLPSVGRKLPMETLSFATAKALRRPFPEPSLALERLKLMRAHPRTELLRADDIPTIHANSLVSKVQSGPGEGDWLPVALNAQREESVRGQLRNRVVLVGWIGDNNDMHETLQGRLPGSLIQASYIEALLDWRYLRPAPLWLQIPFGVGWIALFEWIFRQERSSAWKAPIYALAICVGLGILIYYIAAVNFGFYFSLWPPGLATITIRIAHYFLEHVLARREQLGHATPASIGKVTP
jgi:hypothetical protein